MLPPTDMWGERRGAAAPSVRRIYGTTTELHYTNYDGQSTDPEESSLSALVVGGERIANVPEKG